jgi:chromosomal replication initiation ATPase DnaA
MTKVEKELIENYNHDFYEKTGKKLEIRVLDKWESVCKIEQEISVTHFVNLICHAAGWDTDAIFVSKKSDNLVLKRGVIYFILRNNNVSFKKLELLSGKDHSTIIKALESFENQLQQKRYIGDLLCEIMEYVTENL